MKSLLFLATGMIALCAPPLSMVTFAQPLLTQSPGFYRVQLGSFTVTALSDGTLGISHAKLLHGGSQAEIDQTYRNAGVDDNHRETSINAFLIDTGSKRILVDAGAGDLFGACCGHVPEMLAAAGYDVNSIDTILLTHVHGDHSGGITGKGKRVFPNATLYLAKDELNYWMSDEAKAKAKASHQAMFVTGRAALAPYLAADRVQTFTAGAEIFPGIRTIATPGHTPISAKLCTQVEVFVFCLARRGQRRFDSSFLRQSEDAAQEQSRRWSGERGTEIHATGCAYVLSDM
jgi:glyoxylase-like metal-dependent hydrolase (beta-lactamase superfamily II)